MNHFSIHTPPISSSLYFGKIKRDEDFKLAKQYASLASDNPEKINREVSVSTQLNPWNPIDWVTRYFRRRAARKKVTKTLIDTPSSNIVFLDKISNNHFGKWFGKKRWEGFEKNNEKIVYEGDQFEKLNNTVFENYTDLTLDDIEIYHRKSTDKEIWNIRNNKENTIFTFITGSRER